jgi:hypothetical protein
VDFSEMVNITNILVAGRHLNGDYVDQAEKLRLEFQRKENDEWMSYPHQNPHAKVSFQHPQAEASSTKMLSHV